MRKKIWNSIRNLFYFPKRTVPTEEEMEKSINRTFMRGEPDVEMGIVEIIKKEDIEASRKKALKRRRFWRFLNGI